MRAFVTTLPFWGMVSCASLGLPVDDPLSLELSEDTAVEIHTPDPFEPYPTNNEGLINHSFSLEETLEHGALDGACDAWKADPLDNRLKLLCGKAMFFYEGFGTLGIPEPIMDWVSRNFPDSDEAGLAFTNFGLVKDPYRSTADQPRHLGVGEGAPMGGTPTLALTCAGCHFGQLPDGRYSVGYPNLEYDYSAHMLSMFLIPQRGIPGFKTDDYHPDAIAKIQPMLNRFDEDFFLSMGMMVDMIPMLMGGEMDIPYWSMAAQGQYASWAPGTMDFTIVPLPIDDEVHTVSRTLPLWDIPSGDQEAEYGMEHGMLAWTGSAISLSEFLGGFVQISDGPIELWGPDEMEPLHDYIMSLRSPEPLVAPNPDDVAAGRELFRTSGCEDCHSGPSGSGVRVFSFAEIGTDDALARWGDADGDGIMCCGVDNELTGGIKAPRLGGVHSLSRFLHNGSIGSLEELLCIEERPFSPPSPFANHGHRFGCELSHSDRSLLLSFLRSI